LKKSVYIETTIISYQSAKPSRDIIVLAHQQITNEWWNKRRKDFHNFISAAVIDEIKAGYKSASKKRLELIEEFELLPLSSEVEKISNIYVKQLQIPEKSIRDTIHLAVASLNEIDYLLTWNCKHLANGEIIKKLVSLNKKLKIHTPIICTPEELLEGRNDK